MIKVVTKWEKVAFQTYKSTKIIHPMDAFEFDDGTYCYDWNGISNDEAEQRNETKQRFTLSELNNIWHNTPLARCARREIAPIWVATEMKAVDVTQEVITCECGTDKIGGGIHSDWCKKAENGN